MIAHIPIKCPYCKKTHNVHEGTIGDLLSRMKMNKMLQVAQQMADKSGLFYVRWLAAMESRGEQMRCKWCVGLHSVIENPRYLYTDCYTAGHRGGQYACNLYVQRSGD